MQYRYYNSRIGRFMSADLLSGSIGVPQSINKFGYVINASLDGVDPMGLDREGRWTILTPDAKFAHGSESCYVNGFASSCAGVMRLIQVGSAAVCPTYNCILNDSVGLVAFNGLGDMMRFDFANTAINRFGQVVAPYWDAQDGRFWREVKVNRVFDSPFTFSPTKSSKPRGPQVTAALPPPEPLTQTQINNLCLLATSLQAGGTVPGGGGGGSPSVPDMDDAKPTYIQTNRGQWTNEPAVQRLGGWAALLNMGSNLGLCIDAVTDANNAYGRSLHP